MSWSALRMARCDILVERRLSGVIISPFQPERKALDTNDVTVVEFAIGILCGVLGIIASEAAEGLFVAFDWSVYGMGYTLVSICFFFTLGCGAQPSSRPLLHLLLASLPAPKIREIWHAK